MRVDGIYAGSCPSCHNGRLLLFRESETGDVYGHCEECEQGYRTPAEVESNSGFLTLLNDADADWATEDEIREVYGRTIGFYGHRSSVAA